jgi:beta-glucosidase
VAAVIFGDVNASGKLPITFPVNLADLAASSTAQYPGVSGNAYYSEGVFVGYRHYDENNITPLFPFGFGLSYTTFSLQDLTMTPSDVTFSNNAGQRVTVAFSATNTGNVSGAEVVQLYVGIPSTAVHEPPKSLKLFQKVTLLPGQRRPLQLVLDKRAFSYWDVTAHDWLVAPGTYQIMVGTSSRDIQLQGQITIN